MSTKIVLAMHARDKTEGDAEQEMQRLVVDGSVVAHLADCAREAERLSAYVSIVCPYVDARGRAGEVVEVRIYGSGELIASDTKRIAKGWPLKTEITGFVTVEMLRQALDQARSLPGEVSYGFLPNSSEKIYLLSAADFDQDGALMDALHDELDIEESEIFQTRAFAAVS